MRGRGQLPLPCHWRSLWLARRAGTTEEDLIPADQILDEATRIADLLLDVQTRVNGQIDAALTDLLPGVQQRLGASPADALPVVTTTWALSRFPLESRLRFLRRLDEAAVGRTVAWVSAEGVGVAPAIPTLGDRRASGHSTLGLALLDGAALRAEAIGRCWSRGRLLAWLAHP